MSRRIVLKALVASIVILSAGAALAETKTISGTVTYHNRSMLRPGAVLDLQLLDVSRADVSSVQLAAMRYAISGVPFPFTLTYDTSLIDDRMTYTVQAIISLKGRVIYRSTSINPVLTRGGTDTVDIVVDLMPAHADKFLEGTDWQLTALNGRALITEKRPSISFLPGGKVAMDGGCNRFNGSVEMSGDDLKFPDQMAGTRMACAPPYGQLEKAFLGALVDVSGYVRTGGQLTLVNAAGVAVMRLSQVK